MTKRRIHWQSGQSVITVIIFVIIAIAISSAAIVLTLTGSGTSTAVNEGNAAFVAAEGGVENALLRLLRDPSYTGETLIVGDKTVQIAVTGSGPFIVTSTARSGNFLRKIRATVDYTNNVLTVTSWQEIP